MDGQVERGAEANAHLQPGKNAQPAPKSNGFGTNNDPVRPLEISHTPTTAYNPPRHHPGGANSVYTQRYSTMGQASNTEVDPSEILYASAASNDLRGVAPSSEQTNVKFKAVVTTLPGRVEEDSTADESDAKKSIEEPTDSPFDNRELISNNSDELWTNRTFNRFNTPENLVTSSSRLQLKIWCPDSVVYSEITCSTGAQKILDILGILNVPGFPVASPADTLPDRTQIVTGPSDEKPNKGSTADAEPDTKRSLVQAFSEDQDKLLKKDKTGVVAPLRVVMGPSDEKPDKGYTTGPDAHHHPNVHPAQTSEKTLFGRPGYLNVAAARSNFIIQHAKMYNFETKELPADYLINQEGDDTSVILANILDRVAAPSSVSSSSQPASDEISVSSSQHQADVESTISSSDGKESQLNSPPGSSLQQNGLSIGSSSEYSNHNSLKSFSRVENFHSATYGDSPSLDSEVDVTPQSVNIQQTLDEHLLIHDGSESLRHSSSHESQDVQNVDDDLSDEQILRSVEGHQTDRGLNQVTAPPSQAALIAALQAAVAPPPVALPLLVACPLLVVEPPAVGPDVDWSALTSQERLENVDTEEEELGANLPLLLNLEEPSAGVHIHNGPVDWLAWQPVQLRYDDTIPQNEVGADADINGLLPEIPEAELLPLDNQQEAVPDLVLGDLVEDEWRELTNDELLGDEDAEEENLGVPLEVVHDLIFIDAVPVPEGHIPVVVAPPPLAVQLEDEWRELTNDELLRDEDMDEDELEAHPEAVPYLVFIDVVPNPEGHIPVVVAPLPLAVGPEDEWRELTNDELLGDEDAEEEELGAYQEVVFGLVFLDAVPVPEGHIPDDHG